MYFIFPIIIIIVLIPLIYLTIQDFMFAIFSVLVTLILILYFSISTYDSSDRSTVNKSNISVLSDESVAIIRVDDDYQETFTTKFDYDQIKLGNFKVKKQKFYNIFNKLIETKYIVLINNIERSPD